MEPPSKKRRMEGSKMNEKLVLELFDKGCVKFGEFTLKSGIQSPFYIDLRVIVSYPHVLQMVADEMWNLVKDLDFDLMCGIPYTALPMATAMSLKSRKPMLMRRKEKKKYGTKKEIEGVWKEGQSCLVVEDLVTSAMSCFETIAPLNAAGLKVTDVVVLLDREQGGRTNLTNGNVNLHSVFSISEVVECLVEKGKLGKEVMEQVKKFCAENQVVKSLEDTAAATAGASLALKKMSFADRAHVAKNPVAKAMFELMNKKATNLCVSADVTTCDEVLKLAEAVGEHICLLKTHVDILKDFTPDFVEKLAKIAKEKDFLLFEDRKFADIGNTAMNQYAHGVYKIASWADITNAHLLSGPGVIEGLKKGLPADKPRGLLLLTEMSSKGNLLTSEFKDKGLAWADEHADFVAGFICQGAMDYKHPHLIHMTPGVNLESKGDNLGQQYNTPKVVVGEKLSDMIIVGRGVYRAEDQKAAAKKYRDAAWEAYTTRLTHAL